MKSKVTGKGYSRRVLAVAAAAVLLCGMAGCGGADGYAWNLRPAPQALTGEVTPERGKALLTNGRLSLSVDPEDYAVRVTDHRRQVVWASNPTAEKLTPALRSQFSLSFYDSNGNYSTMNSFTDAVERKQVKVYRSGDTLSVEYRLGDYTLTADCVPQKMSIRRFESFVKKLPADKAEQLSGYYRRYESENMVGIRPKGVNEFMTVRQLWLEAGYTDDDLLNDNAEFGLNATAANRPYFTVVLQYTLHEDGFTVSVPTERLLFDDTYPLYDLTLFENFGRQERTDEGFIFLPDGSGALVNFDPANTRREKASLAVYGEDLTVTGTAKLAQQVNSERTVLPVFGMADGGAGFIAVIEEGEANAYIEAYRSGGYNAYNAGYARFLVINKDNVYLEGSSSESSKVPQFQRTLFDGEYRVRYILLDGGAGYGDMAVAYRQYLMEQGVLRQAENLTVPLVIETLGGVTGYKNFAGISYVGVKPATTYEENTAILEAFRQQGVGDMELVLTGWFGGGVYHSYPAKLPLIGTLGGRKGLDALLRYADEAGIPVFPDANLMTVYRGGSGFYAPNDASRTLDLNTAKLYTLSFATGLRRTDDGVRQTESYILSPNRLAALTEKFLSALGKRGFTNVSLRSSGNELYADYDRVDSIDRVASRQKSEESLAAIAKAMERVMVREGNRYALPYATHILNAADESSGYQITSADVPFLQMVLHGSKTLAGAPANLQPDYRTAVLRAAEYGMSLHLQLTYEPSHYLKNTDCAENYSSYYADWLEIMAQQQKQLSEALTPVANALMVSHRAGENGVSVTRYDNGYATYVNYSSEEQTAGGRVLAPESFLTVREVTE